MRRRAAAHASSRARGGWYYLRWLRRHPHRTGRGRPTRRCYCRMPPIAAGGAAPSGGCPRGPDGSPPWATSPPSIGLPNTAGCALTLGRSCRQLEALPAVFRIEQRGERLAAFGDFTARIRDAQDRAVHGGLLGPRPVELDFDIDLAFQRSLDG